MRAAVPQRAVAPQQVQARPSQPAGQNLNPNGDFQISQPLPDGISSLSVSPTANVLVATCWNNHTYCYQIDRPQPQARPQAIPKTVLQGSAPVLCSSFTQDGSGVFVGGIDKMIRLWDLSTNQTRQVAAHDAPIKHCAFIPQLGQHGMLVTGSWDQTSRYWDLRSSAPAGAVRMPERVYAMDVKHPLLVVGCADKSVSAFDVRRPEKTFYTEKPSSSCSMAAAGKLGIRCVAALPEARGFVVGSEGGRGYITRFTSAQTKDEQASFIFKCHRLTVAASRPGQVPYVNVYAVNDIKVHPTTGTVLTTGGDGTIGFWDIQTRKNIKVLLQATYSSQMPATIPCCAYSRDGSILAYGVSYDWSRGHQAYDPRTMPNYIHLHTTEARPPAAAGPSYARR